MKERIRSMLGNPFDRFIEEVKQKTYLQGLYRTRARSPECHHPRLLQRSSQDFHWSL